MKELKGNYLESLEAESLKDSFCLLNDCQFRIDSETANNDAQLFRSEYTSVNQHSMLADLPLPEGPQFEPPLSLGQTLENCFDEVKPYGRSPIDLEFPLAEPWKLKNEIGVGLSEGGKEGFESTKVATLLANRSKLEQEVQSQGGERLLAKLLKKQEELMKKMQKCGITGFMILPKDENQEYNPMVPLKSNIFKTKTISEENTSTTEAESAPALPEKHCNAKQDEIYNTLAANLNFEKKPVQRPRSRALEGKCYCRHTKCLKMYCECFKSGKYCKNCNCRDCSNTSEQHKLFCGELTISQQRMEKARIKKIIKEADQKKPNSTLVGCNCNRTGCIKNYCACYRSGKGCLKGCLCINCKNTEEDRRERKLKLIKASLEKKKSRAPNQTRKRLKKD